MWERYIEDAQHGQTMSLKDHSDIFLGSQMIISLFRLLNLSSTNQGSQSKVVCFKGLLRSLLPKKGEWNSGYRDVELGQDLGERKEKR